MKNLGVRLNRFRGKKVFRVGTGIHAYRRAAQKKMGYRSKWYKRSK